MVWANQPRAKRIEIARKRLISVLGRHGIATARTLEQKISDAGPGDQRIDPHVLTTGRNALIQEGRIIRVSHAGVPWFHLGDAAPAFVAARLAEQLPVYRELNHHSVSMRLGQTLEIATYRALCADDGTEFYGRFKNLEAHDDSASYSKEEPPQHIGRRSLAGDQRLDFIIRHPTAGALGIECKNIREWLYPDRLEITEALAKCLVLDCVPVLISRRIPYVTFLLLSACGVLMHQTYNQLLPQADLALADRVRHKTLLGYHDIRTGNQPDGRLQKFVNQNLPNLADEARAKFAANRDLLEAFSAREMTYKEFAARVRRRTNGLPEDNDWYGDPADWPR